jgi:endonuclease/exonuclease/phosphatase (EEP) superfamily protein YafD
LAAFLGLFGARLIPPAAQNGDGAPLRVATFNLHYAVQDAQLADSIAAIRAQRADVVALQELSIPAAAAIQRDLIGAYPYQALAPSELLTGMGLISRYPLELPRPVQQLPAQMALVRMGGVDVTLLNVSLAAPEIKRRRLPLARSVKWIRGYQIADRSRDIERVLRAIDQVRGPLVVAGDFNLSDREPDYAQFVARLQDVYRASNWGFGNTFPGSTHLGAVPLSVPLIRIDYVWSGGGAIPAAARVACGRMSDHCMVIADVRVAGEP